MLLIKGLIFLSKHIITLSESITIPSIHPSLGSDYYIYFIEIELGLE